MQNNQNNLKPIQEEFEIGNRVAKLKGKKIRVKRLVKKENGDYTMRDESTILNQTTDSNITFDLQSHQTTEFNRQTNNNILTNQQNFQIDPNNFKKKTNFEPNQSSQNYDESVIKNRKVFENKKDILNEIDRAPEQQNLKIFKSHTQGQLQKELGFEKYYFKLPKQVDTFLNQEQQIKEKIKQEMMKQRQQALQQIDDIRQVFDSVLVDYKQKVSAYYETFYFDFTQNLNEFKNDCNKFIEYNEMRKSQNLPQNNSGKTRIHQVQYWDKRNNQMIKKEQSEQIIESYELQKFLNKKKLSFQAENLEKRILHIPQYANTNSTQEELQSIKENVLKSAKKDLQGLDELVYFVEHPPFKNVEIKCQKEDIVQQQSQNQLQFVTRVSQRIEPRRSFAPVNLQNSVTPLLMNQGSFNMKQSQMNPMTKSFAQMTKSQYQTKLVNYTTKKDFEFSAKFIEVGNEFQGREFRGIFQYEDFYLLYGDEFYYKLDPNSGKVNAMTFQDKAIQCINCINTKYSNLNLKNQTLQGQIMNIKKFLLIGVTDKKTQNSEVIVGIYKNENLYLLKRIQLETKSQINNILPLKDLHTFLVPTEDGSIYLCDLSMKKPKSMIDKCQQKIIQSCAILQDQVHFCVALRNNQIYIFEVMYQKVKMGDVVEQIAIKIELIRVINDRTSANQLKATGHMLFEGVNNLGEYVSIDLGIGDVKDTQAIKEKVMPNPIDRFFLIKNRNIGTTTKKQVKLVYIILKLSQHQVINSQRMHN